MAVMALYILLGTFLDEVSTILITVPVTLPLINSIGYDGIWFGIFVTVTAGLGGAILAAVPWGAIDARA